MIDASFPKPNNTSVKGIILAGGSGSRLFPMTHVVCKQLLPIYDKPMIYYPLSVLMLAGIRDILIITTPEDSDKFKTLFGDGSHIGLRITYAIQPKPEGLAQAFIIGKEFINDENCCLILGDNLFFGHSLPEILNRAVQMKEGGLVFGYWVRDPERYGVVEFDREGNVLSIEEKPKRPKSNYALPGLYFFDKEVTKVAANIKPSERGELEITEVIKSYLQGGRLKVELLGRGFAWLDTGTQESFLEAAVFVETLQKRQGLKIACIEEIAWRMGYVSNEQLSLIAKPYRNNEYGQYLLDILSENN